MLMLHPKMSKSDIQKFLDEQPLAELITYTNKQRANLAELLACNVAHNTILGRDPSEPDDFQILIETTAERLAGLTEQARDASPAGSHNNSLRLELSELAASAAVAVAYITGDWLDVQEYFRKRFRKIFCW